MQKHGEGLTHNKQQLPDLKQDLDQGLQALRHEYQQSFDKFIREHKLQFYQLKWDSCQMQEHIQDVHAQVEVLQVSLSKVASKQELPLFYIPTRDKFYFDLC